MLVITCITILLIFIGRDMSDAITFKIRDPKFKKTNRFLERMLNLVRMGHLDTYGRKGVRALADATPKGETGLTADSWSYSIERRIGSTKLIFHNSNVPEGANVSVAILLQYGHANRAGIFVEGVDYINPAMKPVFDDIVNWIKKEVTAS